MAKPVVIVESGGLPVVNVADALPATPVGSLGMPVTLVSSLGKPVTLANHAGGAYAGTSFVSATFAAASTVTIPTHQAGDLIVGFAINADATTPPTFDNDTEGWTEIVLPSSGIGTTSATIAFAKFAAGSSEGFGTHTNATRTMASVWRMTNPPATIAAALGAVAFDNKPTGGSTNRWVALTQTKRPSHVFTIMLAQANQAVGDRTDTISQGGSTSGLDRLRWGRSNGLVETWPQMIVTVGANTETLSVALEIIA